MIAYVLSMFKELCFLGGQGCGVEKKDLFSMFSVFFSTRLFFKKSFTMNQLGGTFFNKTDRVRDPTGMLRRRGVRAGPAGSGAEEG